MKYEAHTGVSGGWVDKKVLTNGMKAKIVSETKPVLSNFKGKNGEDQYQDVAKVRFQGLPDAVNVNINKPNIAALIEAFGDDSVNWQGHTLTVELEKVRIGGKAATALYLLPDGFKKIDDENGYAVVVRADVKEGVSPAAAAPAEELDPRVDPEDAKIKPEDIPW